MSHVNWVEETPGIKPGDLLECKINGRWVRCPAWTWRSWSGGRRLNGTLYYGPVYFLGSHNVAREAKEEVTT